MRFACCSEERISGLPAQARSFLFQEDGTVGFAKEDEGEDGSGPALVDVRYCKEGEI